MEMSVLVFTVLLLLSFQYFSFKGSRAFADKEKQQSNIIAQEPLKQAPDQDSIIKELRQQIENIEDSNIKTIDEIFSHREGFDTTVKNNFIWNFNHFAIPSLIVDRNKTIIEANVNIYKTLARKGVNQEIVGLNLTQLHDFFDKKYEEMLAKVDYVWETGQNEMIDTIDVLEKTMVLYRIYITRCKVFDSVYLLLQFVRFPLAPKKIIDFGDKVSLGLLKDSTQAYLLVDNNCNIVDMNFSALNFLNNSEIHGYFKDKIYTLYPSLNTREALEAAEAEGIVTLTFLGNKMQTRLVIDKISLQIGDYYLMKILNMNYRKVEIDADTRQ